MSRNIDEKLLILVAKLYYEEGKSQAEVAEMLDASQAKVSRLLKLARSRGIIRITVAQFEPRHTALELELQKRFFLRHVVVVKQPAKATPVQVRGMVGHAAAPTVAQLIPPGGIVGVAGGRTLHQVINWVKGENAKGVRVVQLMGSIEANTSALDAIELGRTLAERMQGAFYALNAPAIVSDRTTRDVFLRHDQIRGIWDLYKNVDVALVGVGSLDDSVFIERRVFSPKDIEYLRRQGAAGEILGRFFDHEGQECQTVFRDRVIGMELDRVRAVKEVVGVVVGADRAASVRAAMRGRLLKSLVIDQAGAEAILAPEDQAAKRRTKRAETGLTR
ncbi:MAG: hypothetical protein JW809_04960 [Pirellulales bacterium]|nr:hypothetical protein [Pirellulales bacterium]